MIRCHPRVIRLKRQVSVLFLVLKIWRGLSDTGIQKLLATFPTKKSYFIHAPHQKGLKTPCLSPLTFPQMLQSQTQQDKCFSQSAVPVKILVCEYMRSGKKLKVVKYVNIKQEQFKIYISNLCSLISYLNDYRKDD